MTTPKYTKIKVIKINTLDGNKGYAVIARTKYRNEKSVEVDLALAWHGPDFTMKQANSVLRKK